MGKGQKSEVQKKRKSRDAARQRRGQQNDEFSELASHLPLPMSVSSQLDRLCIMRLTNSYVKVKHVIKEMIANCPMEHDTEIKADPDMCLFDASALDALGGFVFVVSMDGQCVYTSPNVIDYLGISQLEMTGCSMYKFVHPCDQEELAKQLDGQVPLEDMEIFDGLFCGDTCSTPQGEMKPVAIPETKTMKSTFRSFFLRMKSTITSRGKSVNLNASIFRVVHCLGSVHYYCTSFSKNGEGIENKYLVTIGTPLLSSDSFEVPLDRMTFTTTHGLDMKLLSCEERMNDLIGFSPTELIGKSWYCFTHACDTDVLKNCHKIVLSKGQGISGYYRMMTKYGGWVWMQTKGNVVYSNVSFQPQYIICVNYLISGVEAADQLLSSEQMKELDKLMYNIKGSRKRDQEEVSCTEAPATKLSKSNPVPTLTPPYSDEETEIKPFDPWMSFGNTDIVGSTATWSKVPKVEKSEVYVPTSGEEDMHLLQSHQENYEDKLVEEYSIHLEEDDDDFDDELPSLEFVNMDEELGGMGLTEKSLDELLEDESFLARAPFIPPPTVDEMLTSLLDSNGVDSDEDDDMMVEDYSSRAPYIPESSFDIPLSFDELEASPLPLVPEFQGKAMKIEKKLEDKKPCIEGDKGQKCCTISKRGKDVQVQNFDGGGKQKQFYTIGSASVPRDVIQHSLKEGIKARPKEMLSKNILGWRPEKKLPEERKLVGYGKAPIDVKRGINLGKEALVFGRMSAMPYITNDDAEVNAPTTSLLQGVDLLKALDFVSV